MPESNRDHTERCWNIRRSAAFIGVIVTSLVLSAPAAVLSADYVIHISVDGLRSSYLQQVINAGNAPNLRRLQEEGAWTNNARTDYAHTNTLPNHTSMFTGRPVCSPVGPGCNPVGAQHTLHHGYTDNGDPQITWTLHNQGNLNIPYKASTFDVAHDAGLSTALYASKSKFVIYEQSYNALTGAPHPNGPDKIDTYFAASNSAPQYSLTTHNQFLANTAANPARYTFLHYADPDSAGHNSGWGSGNYLNAIVTVNNYLGAVLNLVETNATLAGQTTIILTSDHGGVGNGHSAEANMFNYTIPFYVWGAGVDHGSLYDMNLGTRTDPGTSRPTYTAAGQPVRNGDSGNLALDLLGLGPIPGSSINATQNLNVTLPGDYYPGDYNFDDVVNAADYIKWRKSFGINYTQGDFNTWRAHFGQIDGSGSGSALGKPAQLAVPEPSCLLLLALSGMFWTIAAGIWRHRWLVLSFQRSTYS